jgi:hypothetical protein
MRRRRLILAGLAIVGLSALTVLFVIWPLGRPRTAAGEDVESQLVHTIHEFGGTVIRDDTQEAKPIVAVSLSFQIAFDKQPTDEILKALTVCKQLRTVSLWHNEQVTDEGVKALAQCRSLRELDLSECANVTDEGVRALAQCEHLHRLDLSGCPAVTAGAVADLKKALPELEVTR